MTSLLNLGMLNSPATDDPTQLPASAGGPLASMSPGLLGGGMTPTGGLLGQPPQGSDRLTMLGALLSDLSTAKGGASTMIATNQILRQQKMAQAQYGLVNGIMGAIQQAGQGGAQGQAQPTPTVSVPSTGTGAPALTLPDFSAPQPQATQSPGLDYNALRSKLSMAGLLGIPGVAEIAAMYKPDIKVGPDGTTYDENSPASLGRRFANRTAVNNSVIDLNDPANTNRVIPTAPFPGAIPNQDASGNVIGWQMPTGLPQLLSDHEAAITGGQEAGKAPYVAGNAYNQAAGTGAGSAPTDLIDVPMGNGQTMKMPRSLYLAQFGQGGGGLGGPGGPGATPPQGGMGAPGGLGGGQPGLGIGGIGGRGLGLSQSPADAEFDKGQASDASKQLSTDMDARGGALQSLSNAKQALTYVQQNGNATNPALPHLVASANYLRALPPSVLGPIAAAVNKSPSDITGLANDAGVYQRLSSQDLLSFSKTNLPSRYTEREMAVAGKVIPQLTTAPDAATYHWGLQAAIANKQVQRADFASSYSGPKNRQGVEAAWNSTPAGQTSLFEDPIWQGVQIAGAPAVTYKTTPQGITFGAVGIGTGHPTYFRALGQH